MHSLHGQNVFLPSCGLKSRIIHDRSINRSCERCQTGDYLTRWASTRFFSTFQQQSFWIAAYGLENKEFVLGQKTVQVHPREGCQKVI